MPLEVTQVLSALSSLFGGEAGSAIVRAINERTLKQSAIEQTAKKFDRTWHVEEALKQWTEAPGFDMLLRRLRRGDLRAVEQEIVEDFIEEGDFVSGVGDERVQRAEKVVTQFFDALLRLSVKDPEAVDRLKAILSNVEEGQEATHEALDYIRSLLERPPFDHAHRRYLDRLRAHCQVLHLAPLGGKGGDKTAVTLDQVYIRLDTTTLRDTEDTTAYVSTGQGEPDLLSAMEAVEKTERLVLLGDPGAGKSTFVKQLLAEYARALRTEGDTPAGLPRDMVPVLITLRDLVPRLEALDLEKLPGNRRAPKLASLLREQALADLEWLGAPSFADGLNQQLLDGNCLLVLDGLDEVPYDLRPMILQVVEAAGRFGSFGQIIVTCRIRSYVGEARLPGFEAHTLASFQPDQIRSFASAWYAAQHQLGHVDAKQCADAADDLAGVATSEELLGLAQNPMLLTTLALIHQDQAELPRERVRLFKQAVDLLVRKWRKHQAGREKLSPSEALTEYLLHDERLWPTLERLAYEAHQPHRADGDGKQAADLPREEALAILCEPQHVGDDLAETFLDYVDERAGLLVGRGGAPGAPLSYSFPHRHFQEYLAGCYLIGQRNRDRTIYGLAGEGDYWSEAVALAAEEMHFVRSMRLELLDLMYHLCPRKRRPTTQDERAVLWSARIAEVIGEAAIARDTEHPDGGKSYLDRVRDRLTSVLGGALPAPERAEAGRALARLGDPRKEVLTLDALPLCHVPAGPFRMGKGEELHENTTVDYAYWISKYPVTQAQFHVFVRDGGYAEETFWTEGGWAWRTEQEAAKPPRFGEPFDLDNHPVVGVTWHEAHAFTRWLTLRLRRAGILPEGWSVALPSEAEWEKAARGGLRIPDGPTYTLLKADLQHPESPLQQNPLPARRYPWDGEVPDPNRANYDETGIGSTNAVGCFPGGASPYGVEDLSGNVWEWTRSLWGEDWQEPTYGYPYDPEDGREVLGAPDAVLRVVRGGAFTGLGGYARCAFRLRYSPTNRFNDLGFRVVVLPFPLDSGTSGR